MAYGIQFVCFLTGLVGREGRDGKAGKGDGDGEVKEGKVVEVKDGKGEEADKAGKGEEAVKAGKDGGDGTIGD